jgi:energy-coupling factor transporter ATP-binding protein EcfA2
MCERTWGAPDVLLLDEPTNHLDRASVARLAAAMDEYEGAVLVVSHDRDLLVASCCDLWVVEDGRLMVFCGDGDGGGGGFAAVFEDYAGVVASGMTVAQATLAGGGGEGGGGVGRVLRSAARREEGRVEGRMSSSFESLLAMAKSKGR